MVNGKKLIFISVFLIKKFYSTDQFYFQWFIFIVQIDGVHWRTTGQCDWDKANYSRTRFFFVLSTLTYEIYDLFFFSIECHNIQVIEKDEHDMDVGHLTITNESSL